MYQNFFSRAQERLAAPFQNNSIIQYVYKHDDKKFVAWHERNSRIGAISNIEAGRYLQKLITKYNKATYPHKIEFLQKCKDKLFAMIIGLLQYFTSDNCSNILPRFLYLDDLTRILALDGSIESEFYHSEAFKNVFIRYVKYMSASPSFEDYIPSGKLSNFFLRMIGKYPSILSVQNISRELEDFSQIMFLLSFLKRTSNYLNGKLSDDAISNFLLFFDCAVRSRKELLSYSSILIGFLQQPNKLINYFINYGRDHLDLLAYIIETELKLREVCIDRKMIFGFSSHHYFFSETFNGFYFKCIEEQQYQSEFPQNLKFEQWRKSTLHTIFGQSNNILGTLHRRELGRSTRLNIPLDVAVLRELQTNETARNNFKTLFEEGISPDMAARMIFHNIRYPQDLLPEIPAVRLFMPMTRTITLI